MPENLIDSYTRLVAEADQAIAKAKADAEKAADTFAANPNQANSDKAATARLLLSDLRSERDFLAQRLQAAIDTSERARREVDLAAVDTEVDGAIQTHFDMAHVHLPKVLAAAEKLFTLLEDFDRRATDLTDRTVQLALHASRHHPEWNEYKLQSVLRLLRQVAEMQTVMLAPWTTILRKRNFGRVGLAADIEFGNNVYDDERDVHTVFHIAHERFKDRIREVQHAIHEATQ